MQAAEVAFAVAIGIPQDGREDTYRLRRGRRVPPSKIYFTTQPDAAEVRVSEQLAKRKVACDAKANRNLAQLLRYQ
eukprot:12046253-Heterocapsa_arctica.AAC.1